MPPVTKRTKVTQSNTLLGFFSTPTSVSPSKSGSSTSPSKPTRTQGKQRVRAAPAEVIVIDSDSDCELNEDPAKISGGKRKRASAHTQIVLDDDEVQIVGPPSSKIEAKSPIIKAESKPSSASKTLEQPAPATPTTGSSVNIEGAHPSAMDLDFTLSRCIATSSKVKLEAFQDDERLIELSDWSDAEDTYTPGGHLQDLDDQPEDDKAEILEVVKPEISESPPSAPPTRASNAFSAIMSGNREGEAWKEASTAEKKGWGRQPANTRRSAPFYKVLQGFPIAVDAFRYGAVPGVTGYFLTHAHSDHYTNLSSKWEHGPIYCSAETANVIAHLLSVDRKWLRPLPMNVTTPVPDSGGVSVTLIDANHCPGSCLFMFEGPQTLNAGDSNFKSSHVGSKRIFRYLHCGDFRASPQHINHPSVRGKKLDIIYLDTTYLDPRYVFPSQPEVIAACADLAKKLVYGHQPKPAGNNHSVTSFFSVAQKVKTEPSESTGGNKGGGTLFVVGTYSIGKERILKAVASALNSKVYCDNRKAAILRCLDDPELHEMLTKDPLEANVHLVPLSVIATDKLKLYLERFNGHFTKVIGFRPTGWTYAQQAGATTTPTLDSVITKCQQRKLYTCDDIQLTRNSSATVGLYGVPYSEHSSFFELTCFALSLEWDRIIATVNVGSEKSRGNMKRWVDKWAVERAKKGAGGVKERDPHYW
ncbi:DNA repair metallo-beta-lactamase-domain-containing protein [Pterulicium gracile]|uniref:DNA repair metallo-beta-lactamase-domain-containing protein n=1 Tax=Pterulicium gracile TaxID=1884261 RepID=A0A5C3QK83_9AGAR|nr:DNA repair metallo-beta-lactamase-domain-containing protein [Pterula gracilis]